jgi:hypothetical protein
MQQVDYKFTNAYNIESTSFLNILTPADTEVDDPFVISPPHHLT